jgi:hypothetical protein
MATMSIDEQIMKYLPQLHNEEEKSILSVIKSFMRHKEEPATEGRMTIDEYNHELHGAETRYDAGSVISHDDVLKEAESW